jgi:hypothetical protein
MADGPQLKRARDRALSKSPLEEDDRRLLEAEVWIASNPEVDPTDRFMASELGLWLGRWTVDEARELLGEDALSVDLLRIPQHASRQLALDWALSHAQAQGSQSADAIAFRSAGAAGPPWWDQLIANVGDSGPVVSAAASGILGWSVPGDEDAGPAKLKDDLPTFERRIARAERLLSSLSEHGRVGLWTGAMQAIRYLPESQTHGRPLQSVRQRLAGVAWSAYAALGLKWRPSLRDLEPLPRDGAAALLRAAPKEGLAGVRHAVVRWYAEDPAAHGGAIRVLAETTHEDPLTLGIEAAQLVLQRTTLPRLSQQLFHQAEDAKRTDRIAAAVVNLAVTTLPDDPDVTRALDRLAEAIIEGYERGDKTEGPVSFSRASWERFNLLVGARIQDALSQEAAAQARAEEATADAQRQRELAEARAQTLSETRASTGSTDRQDTGRLAASLLKPVALAVGDSFEAKSLEALQDRLLAVLQRARIVPVLEVGETAGFNPSRHQWVGDGAPPDRIQARSPGFMLEGEGDDGIVLVPARVVAPAP